MSLPHSFVIPLAAIGIIAIAAGFLVYAPSAKERLSDSTQTAAVIGTETPPSSAASSTPLLPATTTVKNQTKTISRPSTKTKEGASIRRIENPYATPPESFLTVNEWTLGALVNILCTPRSGTLRPISGSGVLIDPHGVILTSAHVAQYVLLSQSPQINLSCVVRAGSPARDAWSAEVLFMPPVWVEEHAADLTADAPTGTGEHDYALLRIVSALDGNPLPTGTPALKADTREGVAFLKDAILVAGYPAEFIGGDAAQNQLYPATSLSTVKDLLTFRTNSVDLISVGGVVAAQSGSSGGAVVNAWGRLVGLITTTSEGATTADRDLRALTISYIDRDIRAQSGSDLSSILNGDLAAEAAAFRNVAAPRLTQMLIDQLSNPNH